MSVLVLDKPVGPSSFQALREVKRELTRLWGRDRVRGLKIGHGGTLDPMASGVLPICIGEGTKLAPFLLDADKEYEAVVRFGAETDTLDAEGAVVATHDAGGISAASVEAGLVAFRGRIDQVPPMYSALKKAGRPLYEYARAGTSVERAPRSVVIHDLVLLEFESPERVRLRVRCSKGTYIRSLAADLGRTLGSGAHLGGLRRLASGPFVIDQAISLGEVGRRVAAGEALPFVSLSDALGHLPATSASEEAAKAMSQGRPVLAESLVPNAGSAPLVRVLRQDGSLLAVAKGNDGAYLRPIRVFAPNSL